MKKMHFERSPENSDNLYLGLLIRICLGSIIKRADLKLLHNTLLKCEHKVSSQTV